MKTINRYILKNFLSNFLTYFLLVSILFYLNYIYQIINPILTRKPNIFVVIKLFLFLFPNIIPLAVPTTFLVSTLLTFSTLNESKELTAIQTMGLKKFFYTKNIIFLSFLFSLILFYFNVSLIPKSYKNFKSLYFNFILSKPYIKFSDNSIFTLDNKKIFTKSVKNNELQNIFIQTFLKEENFLQTIFAKSAKVYNDINDNIIFNLYNGKITTVDTKNIKDLLHLTFEKYIFIIYNSKITKLFNETKTLREMTNKELINEYYSSKNDKHKIRILSEYFLRYSISISIVIFTLLGIVLSLKIKKSAKPLSFVFSILIIIIYYFLLSTSLSIVENIKIPISLFLTFLILQIPNIILFTVYLIINIFSTN
ncbi:MAG: LptF/LptG family permease [Endomicrobiia bacterium]